MESRVVGGARRDRERIERCREKVKAVEKRRAEGMEKREE